MAVEKISLFEIEKFKLDEEFKRFDGSTWVGAENNLNEDFEATTLALKDANGKEKEYLFVPSANQEELKRELMKKVALDELPELTKEYVMELSEKTGASPADIINEYIALVETIINGGEV